MQDMSGLDSSNELMIYKYKLYNIIIIIIQYNIIII